MLERGSIESVLGEELWTIQSILGHGFLRNRECNAWHVFGIVRIRHPNAPTQVLRPDDVHSVLICQGKYSPNRGIWKR